MRPAPQIDFLLCMAMSQGGPLEEDIWEYKSIRKPKCVPRGQDVVTPSTSLPLPHPRKGNGGKKRRKKALGQKAEPETSEQEAPGQALGKEDPSGQVEDDVTAPAKLSGSCNKKQTPQKARPIYEGYCPSCQMPFSLLLVQTPRWHVAECLDAPSAAGKECPDGLLCNSTIPSHYKRYTHFFLAASRAGDYLVDSSAQSPENKFTHPVAAKSSCFPGLLDEISQSEKQTKNVRNAPNDDLTFTVQTSTQAKSPSISNVNASFSMNVKKPEQNLPFTKTAENDCQVQFFGFPFSQESEVGRDLDSQNDSDQLNPLLPEGDVSDCEISYSPLRSGVESVEETEGEENEEKEIKSRKQLFQIQNFDEENSEKEESSCMLYNQFDDSPFQPELGYVNIKMESFIIENAPCREVNAQGHLAGCVRPISQGQTNSSNLVCAANQLKCPQGAPVAEFSLSPNHDKTRKEFDSPKCSTSVSNTGNWKLKDFHGWSWDSVDLAMNAESFSLKVKEEGGSPPMSRQSVILKESGGFLVDKGEMDTNTTDQILSQQSLQSEGKGSLPNTASIPFPSATSKMLPSAFAANINTKELKQMDIGVFFGLKPKAMEESKEEKHPCEGTQPSILPAPNGKRPKRQKRKAEGSVGDLDTVPVNSNTNGVCVGPASGTQRRWRKRFRESSYTEDGTKKKYCPFYKKIPGTGFTVDAFQYGEIEGCTAYFLTHFHSDHFCGLTKNFTFPVYCNKITGNLVKSKLQVQEQYIHILPMDKECMVNGIKVVLLDANHCPGATMILFCLPNGTVILHTGDFRADPSMERYLPLIGRKVHTLYLDTTYCSPEYTFPSQQEVIQFAVNTAFETVTLNPRTLVVCGSYSIGKEKIFLAIAEVLGSKASMSRDKYKTLCCLESAAVNSIITMNWNDTLLHVLPMMQINFKGLQNHLDKFSENFDQILAFKPTGWTYSDSCHSLVEIRPQIRGRIVIYGIPYSEHSSYTEMKRFVQWLKPQKIIPTVNIGDWRARNSMQKHFKDWMTEAAGLE
ncbi:PREDICTED: DNA cross-link repair 1A protein isoform X2 [Gavialis gangeticus]|uniref:DNA cross-link repair 1A protein isoform X2 n=1 Tax=Gavialis gangeticus TaxID=94835 RepID=UPI00092F32D8|nr:PREDICTED: DNA cross-link repair 1A protein isoform X2 [Gavialis gangeticus]